MSEISYGNHSETGEPKRRPFRDRGEGREGGGRRGGFLGGMRRRKKTCIFCHAKGEERLTYKSGDRLKKYLSDRGKILPRRAAGTCAKHQRLLTVIIKRARYMALLPYVTYERSRDGGREGGRDRDGYGRRDYGRDRDGGRDRDYSGDREGGR